MKDYHIDKKLQESDLYSEDLAPVPQEERTWGLWDMTSIWVGMAVCVPTYMLASYMIKSGLSWMEALIIIALGNVIITIPMVLNGHAGVKFGIPFPVIGRAAFGFRGIHIASVFRGIVACGWFGIQTWVGGLAFYELWHALMGTEGSLALTFGKFIAFALFWFINVFFIWKGTESIKWLEKFAAPILIAMGFGLIAWGASAGGGISTVLSQSSQLAQPTAVLQTDAFIAPGQTRAGDMMVTMRVPNGDITGLLSLFPIVDKVGAPKVSQYQLGYDSQKDKLDRRGEWMKWNPAEKTMPLTAFLSEAESQFVLSGAANLTVKFKGIDGIKESSAVVATLKTPPPSYWSRLYTYLFWLTSMVGFWATMAISIADITRYTKTQKNQILGQFFGLPGTMALFSFVGIFVTCAAVINFPDVLVANDAPWDPASLLGKFNNPMVVIVAQILLIIATLSTNIAANVIAPANAFSNLAPKALSFRNAGILTAIIGIITCPWWTMDYIAGLLIFVSAFLGPVLAILVADYYLIRNTELDVEALFDEDGIYRYTFGFNFSALIAMAVGIAIALIGYKVEAVSWLYNLSWFTGFAVSFVLYWLLMRGKTQTV